MNCPTYCALTELVPGPRSIPMVSVIFMCISKASIQLVPQMGLSNILSHCFRKAWCYLWRDHGLLTSMVFCLLAFGMQSTAFAPENLTQICVCRKRSKDLIIFWELYYLSFANQVILQTEKNVVYDPAKAAAQWGWQQARNSKALLAGLSMSRERADRKQLSACICLPYAFVQVWKSYPKQCPLDPFWWVVALS